MRPSSATYRGEPRSPESLSARRARSLKSHVANGAVGRHGQEDESHGETFRDGRSTKDHIRRVTGRNLCLMNRRADVGLKIEANGLTSSRPSSA